MRLAVPARAQASGRGGSQGLAAAGSSIRRKCVTFLLGFAPIFVLFFFLKEFGNHAPTHSCLILYLLSCPDTHTQYPLKFFG